MSDRKTVFVIYHSTWGHVEKLAREVIKGLERAGVNAKLFQVPETLSEECRKEWNAAPKASDVPVIKVEEMHQADGFIFGVPCTFGTPCTQMKTFFDSTNELWRTQALANKFVGVFVSTGNLHGGQETTALTAMPYFVAMGLIYVPLGFKYIGTNYQTVIKDELLGGSTFGAGTLAFPDGSRQPSDSELKQAEFQGFDFGSVVSRFH